MGRRKKGLLTKSGLLLLYLRRLMADWLEGWLGGEEGERIKGNGVIDKAYVSTVASFFIFAGLRGIGR